MNIGQLACMTVALSTMTAAPIKTAPPDGAVRAADAAARRLLDATFAVSQTARRLAADLGRTDVIAYVEVTLSPATPRAGTQLVACTRESRYLRITISAMLGPWERAAMLAHELWHALEIAHAPEVRNQAGLRAFYTHAGASTDGRDRFETPGAIDAERRALTEVQAGATPAEASATRAGNFPVTNGVTNGLSAQHRRGSAPALR